MNNEPLVSIIVPVFNVEDYLDRCLLSIKNQSYSNFEVIIIDDGSTDSSGEVCDIYAITDKRFRVFHQQNKGLSVSRNNALSKARGEYICFVDSDDYILPDFLKSLITLMFQEKADIVKCDYFRGKITSDETEVIKRYSSHEFTEKVIVDEIGSQLWQYLYRASLWEGVISPPGRYAQDMMILHEVTHKANKIVTTSQRLYFYYIDRNNSTSNSMNKKCKGALDRSYAFSLRYVFSLKNGYIDCCNELYIKVLDYFNNALVLGDSLTDKHEDIVYICNFLSSNKKDVVLPFKKNILYYLVTNFPYLYGRIR